MLILYHWPRRYQRYLPGVVPAPGDLPLGTAQRGFAHAGAVSSRGASLLSLGDSGDSWKSPFPGLEFAVSRNGMNNRYLIYL